ncbi:histidine phosphatase family protein [Xylophilus sp. GOD-11R]|uniref:histidine phosphatase family protein n=1 Tax=Xylophilus sp. GOD-11R TaxID=3089814 RepID=UPI00298C509B|nr:histidine phosphatase family protein [Xylophilus sp. GOD-11R]WPB55937.1 histidine phosphatase family protein [Xylophilus sp. GOD-11R]
MSASSAGLDNRAMTDVILIRHGETDWNRAMRFQGQTDVPLNAVGLAQADRLSGRVAAESVHHLVSSDLKRALQTAEPAASQLGLPIATDAGLREQCFGDAEGLTADEIRARRPADWSRWTSFQADQSFEGGESTRRFHTRSIAALRSLAAAHAGRTLLLVTHGGVLDMVFRTARALSLDGPRMAEIPNAGFNRVRVDADGAIEIVVWADTTHLEGLPSQPVYDQTRLARENRGG